MLPGAHTSAHRRQHYLSDHLEPAPPCRPFPCSSRRSRQSSNHKSSTPTRRKSCAPRQTYPTQCGVRSLCNRPDSPLHSSVAIPPRGLRQCHSTPHTLRIGSLRSPDSSGFIRHGNGFAIWGNGAVSISGGLTASLPSTENWDCESNDRIRLRCCLLLRSYLRPPGTLDGGHPCPCGGRERAASPYRIWRTDYSEACS